MNLRTNLTTCFIVLIVLTCLFAPTGLAQEAITIGVSSLANTFGPAQSEDKLHALELTRFHFLTLKEFHSNLFSGRGEHSLLNEKQTLIMNAGLNAFLSSDTRETLLLEALRQKRAVRLRFSVPQKEDAYQVVTDPNRPTYYQFKPLVRQIPATIEIKPLLDSPAAFHVTIRIGNETYRYQIDWTGKAEPLA